MIAANGTCAGGRIKRPPKQVRLVHGDEGATATKAGLLRQRCPGTEVVVP